MTIRNTDQLSEALAAMGSTIKYCRQILDALPAPTAMTERLWNSMHEGGASNNVADEHAQSLGHSLRTIADSLEDLAKEIGSAEHIVAMAVYKTPGYLKYLVF